MTRVCPKRDAVCPHGLDCPFTIDRYNCRDERLPPESEPMTNSDESQGVEVVAKKTMTVNLTIEEMAALEALAANAKRVPTIFRDGTPDREWFERRAVLEGDHEVGAGLATIPAPTAQAPTDAEPLLDAIIRQTSDDDRHDESLIGAAERAVGRWVYRRIERLMDEAEEETPQAAELDALATIVSSIEEYGEEACADHALILAPAFDREAAAAIIAPSAFAPIKRGPKRPRGEGEFTGALKHPERERSRQRALTKADAIMSLATPQPVQTVGLDREAVEAIIKEHKRSINLAFSYDAVDAILALAPAQTGWRPTHRHMKRGTDYHLVGTVCIQADAPVEDETDLFLYRGADGEFWARPAKEFEARFLALPTPPSSGGRG